MLSIILNIITILILICVLTLFLRLYYKQKNKPEKTSDGDSKSATNDEEVTASEVMKNTFDDPLVTSRSYFTESSYGKIGDFKGQQTPSDVYWIEGKPIQALE